MHTWIRHGLIVLACGMLLAGVARTDENDAATISDGPSRAELFQARLAAELGPLGALAAAAAPPFFLPSDAKGDSIFGIDVSHHNDENCRCKPGETCGECKIDWSRARSQKVSFVFLKASQGTGYRDPTFGYHWRTLAQHNISRGAYHFMSADEDPIVQADWFVDRLEEVGKLQAIDLPPCLDLEADLRKDKVKRWIVAETGEKRDFWNGQEPDEILQKVLQWLKRVEERTGRAPIIYTSRGWWNERIKDEKKIVKLQHFPIWIANYPDSGSPLKGKPKVPNGHEWAIWQFTETGRVKESEIVPGNLDINIFNGAMGNFQQALGISVPEEKQVVRVDERTDTSNPAVQVAGSNPSEPPNTGNPPQQATGANPSEPPNTGNPPQQVTGANPSEPPKTGNPPQQVTGTNPSEPAKTGNPPQQVTGANPSEPPNTGNPPQQVTGTNPSEPAKTGNPPQQVTGTNPSEPAKTGNPPQQVTGTNPSEPPQQVTAINPNDPKDTSTPSDQQTNASPNDSKQNTGTSNPRTNSTSRTSQRTSSRTASQRAAAENSQKPAADKMMVEIVLGNGRMIRVDANIDPAVLSRLIGAVDGN
jgi:lysozyme